MLCHPGSKADQIGLFPFTNLQAVRLVLTFFLVELTGTHGPNDAAVSTTPTVVDYGDGGSLIMIVPSGNGLCSVFVQGVVWSATFSNTGATIHGRRQSVRWHFMRRRDPLDCERSVRRLRFAHAG